MERINKKTCVDITEEFKLNRNINRLLNNRTYLKYGSGIYFKYMINDKKHITSFTKHYGEPCIIDGLNGKVKVWKTQVDGIDLYITLDRTGVDYLANISIPELHSGVSKSGEVNIDDWVRKALESIIVKLEPNRD